MRTAALGSNLPGTLSPGNHCPNQVLAVSETRECDPGDMEHDKPDRDLRKHVVHFLDRERRALLARDPGRARSTLAITDDSGPCPSAAANVAMQQNRGGTAMLSYEDCLGLSGLTPEEIAAVAKHEHLPEIVALELGSSLFGTSEGKQLVRRMIVDDIEDACRRGDTRTAGKLGVVLHRFIETHLDRHGPAAHGLDPDAPMAPCVRERVDAYLTAMLGHFGIDRAAAREHFRPEMQVAEMCCAACTESSRCRRFLAGAAEAEPPSAFCPNAPLFDELRGRAGLQSQEA
jgi:Family of unknown function (DUF6455)